MAVESLIAQREVLYMIKQEGCEACEAAAPEFSAFEMKHPGIITLRVDANGPYPSRLGLKVKATPMYLYRRGQEGVTHVGALKSREIEAWLKKLGATL